jgi:chemotaxis protein MotB
MVPQQARFSGRGQEIGCPKRCAAVASAFGGVPLPNAERRPCPPSERHRGRSLQRGMVLILTVALGLLTGCTALTGVDYQALKSQNQALAERNRAQAAELENLQVHTRNTEDQLMRAEQDLALLDEQRGLDRQQLANYQTERDRLHEQFQGLMDHRSKVPPSVSGRLAEISAKYPSLRFDPKTGISKLDTDILFDVGTADLKPGAEQVLGELAGVLKSNEARDLKIMVVGHTDDQPIGRKPARDKFHDNFQLSTDRALAVSSMLSKFGVADSRMGVAGFGASQPVAPNLSAKDRQKNRRVELFVLSPEVPVVGWTDSIPSVY